MTNDRDDADPRTARKERVLHTRVPDVLDQELRRLAENLRVPVSNVVRTILQDAVDTMDAAGQMAEDGVRGVADRLHAQRVRLRHERPADPPAAAPAGPPLADVVGFQRIVLARDTTCSVSGTTLPAGSEAFLGVTDRPTPHRVIVGPDYAPRHVGDPPAGPPAEEDE